MNSIGYGLGLALVAAGADAQQCDPSTFIHGSGTLDSKYGVKTGIATPAACCALCAADRKCGHFVHKGDKLQCCFKKGTVEHAGTTKDASTANYTCGDAPKPAPSPPTPAPAPPPPTPAPPTPPPTPVAPPPLGFQPHIIFFLADDFGRYNAGFRGNAEARTPAIDGLVAEGVLLERQYVYQFCSPTRSAFLSGRLPIHINEANHGPSAYGGVDLRASTVADVLKGAGYATHQTGKWNAGSLLYGQVPTERGFDTSLGYMGGEEDHYTQLGNFGPLPGANYMPAELLADSASFRCNEVMEVGGAGGEQPGAALEGGNTKLVDLLENGTPALGRNGSYAAYMYTNHTVSLIEAHDTATPLFIYHAWQEAHTPNEVPEWELGPALPADSKSTPALRQTYEAMVHTMDSGIGNITAALKAKGMWDRTLIFFSADNGGREDGDFGGNNFPLRGMKFSDFEGGTRAQSFASGGAIPAARRGATESGLMHIADWLHTFAALAGVDATDHKAAEAGVVPPIDSLNMWPTVATGAASPRSEIAISSNAFIAWPYKVVVGKQGGKGVWTGPQHPNSTATLKDDDPGCGDGCLFNIEADPTEHVDLAKASPALLANLTAKLNAAVAGRYQTGDDKYKGKYTNCTSLANVARVYPGFGAPLCHEPN